MSAVDTMRLVRHQETEAMPIAIVRRYIEAFNTGKFERAASAFAANGILYPPIDDAVKGRNAIARYLRREANGMKIASDRIEIRAQQPDNICIETLGKVQTPLFGINAAWTFALNSRSEITSLSVKLLASPEEWLGLQQFA